MCDDWGPNKSLKVHTLLRVVTHLYKIIIINLIISYYLWVAEAFWEKSGLETEIINLLGYYSI